MSERFLLPCSCGKSLEIERRQAGTTVVCSCGQTLEVPTIREIVHLLPANTEAEGPPAPIWGIRQGLIFIGLLVAVPAFVLAFYLSKQIPVLNETWIAENMKHATPLQSYVLWKQYADGMPQNPSIETQAIIRGIQSLKTSINLSIAVGVLGLVVAASALFVRKTFKK